METFLGPDSKPITINRAVKLRGVWDECGHLVQASFFDEHDHTIRNDAGCAKVRHSYEKYGNRVEDACLDEADHLVRNIRGYAKINQVYDERGKVESLERFDSQDQLMQTINRYAVSRYAYDDFGREIQRVLLDLNGSPLHTRVAIRDLEPDSNSQRFGLQIGDLIIGYDGKDVRDTDAFDQREVVKGEGPWELRLLSHGKFVTIDLLPGRL